MSRHWHQNAPCLLNKSFVARVFSFEEMGGVQNLLQGSRVAIYAEDLSLGRLSQLLEHSQIDAIILRSGSLADHVAGLANSNSVQLVIAPSVHRVPPNSYVLIDSLNDRIRFSNDKSALDKALVNLEAANREELKSVTRGCMVASILVDGSNATELSEGLAFGAKGVGLFRSEWMCLNSPKSPSLQSQIEIYGTASRAVRPYRLNVRLFDFGGDKIPKWCQEHYEALRSPLGLRGVRAIPKIASAYRSQLAALANCAEKAQIGIVIPMVTDVHDVIYVKSLLNEIATENQYRNISVGAMVETPSAALTIEEIVKEADFIRIGPGDLSQFTLAKLRRDIDPKDFSGRCFHPAVLNLIQHVASVCGHKGVEVSLCLDIAPRFSLMQSLLNAGISRFAVPSRAITDVLELVRPPPIE